MTDRDHFAAAALTGLCSMPPMSGPDKPHDFAAMAYAYADAMLRCRSGGDCPVPDNAPNHDAAPAATAPEPEPSAARRRPAGGTGDTRESLSGSLPADLGDGVSPSENDKNLHHTQEIAAYRRFVGEVMNWISEATGFLHDDVLRTDDARDFIHNACMRCWDAFDRIAYPTVHGASPEARAESDEDRADKAATSHRRDGTGDTPKPISGCVSDRPTPITGPDPDSRVWETHTPAPHATPGECSVPREGTQEPVAWGVAGLGGILATSTSRTDAVDMQSEYAFVTEIVPLYRQAPDFAPPPPDNAAKAPDNAEPVAWAVMLADGERIYDVYATEEEAKAIDEAVTGNHGVVPLYRSPTLTDAEAETLRELRDEAAQYADEIGLCASEVRGRQRIIDGLLDRLGGWR